MKDITTSGLDFEQESFHRWIQKQQLRTDFQSGRISKTTVCTDCSVGGQYPA